MLIRGIFSYPNRIFRAGDADGAYQSIYLRRDSPLVTIRKRTMVHITLFFSCHPATVTLNL